jgi:hypothetical protein
LEVFSKGARRAASQDSDCWRLTTLIESVSRASTLMMFNQSPPSIGHVTPCGAPHDHSNVWKLYGVYDFAHPKGVFEVHLRSGSRFFAPKFPENSVWTCTNACCADGQTCCQLQIEWGKYGQYDLTMDMAALPPCCSGSAKGNPENWRKVLKLNH